MSNQSDSKKVNNDTALYDFIISGRKGKTAAEKFLIKGILLFKNKSHITDEELKETINQMDFPDNFPRTVKLHLLFGELYSCYGARCSHE